MAIILDNEERRNEKGLKDKNKMETRMKKIR